MNTVIVLEFDKVLHILAGLAICLTPVFLPRTRIFNFIALLLCVAVAICKEEFDDYSYNGSNHLDMRATIIAGWIGCAVAWMFHPASKE